MVASPLMVMRAADSAHFTLRFYTTIAPVEKPLLPSPSI